LTKKLEVERHLKIIYGEKANTDTNKIKPIMIYPGEKINLGGLWHHLTGYVFGLSVKAPYGGQQGTVMAMSALGDPMRYYNEMVEGGVPEDRDDSNHRSTHCSQSKITQIIRSWYQNKALNLKLKLNYNIISRSDRERPPQNSQSLNF
jgi:hypothetical protein